jgi:hypothetical protein
MIAALDLGFLTNNETRPGKPFRLTLKQGVDDAGPSLLPDPNTITQEAAQHDPRRQPTVVRSRFGPFQTGVKRASH